MLFYLNSLSSYVALVAVEMMSLAPSPVTPILVTKVYACCPGKVLIRKVSLLFKPTEDSPLINPNP